MQRCLNFKIQASNTYLGLNIIVYLFSLFITWYYFYSLWLSIVITAILLIGLFYSLPRFLLLTHPNSIVQFSLMPKKLTIKRNNNIIEHYAVFHLQYQSSFLVIINIGKQSMVVFKDALASSSLSTLNQYFNVNT